MQSLTKKQKRVFDFIESYINENGISPTINEIKDGLSLSAVSTVHEHLQILKQKGYIDLFGNEARGVVIKGESYGLVQIPILGKIAAGLPIEAIESSEEFVKISRPQLKNHEDYYALKVEGDSMIDDGIFDGDIVVIKKQSVAENGQTVVAIIDDNQATLKRIYREKDLFRLQPRNPSMEPLFRIDVEIRGVVIDIIHKMKQDMRLTQKDNKKSFRTIDLFAGVGGIRLGFERAGFQTVFANDFEAKCKDTYDSNFSDAKLVVEDIRRIGIDDLPEFDFLLGGFPCQAFSIAGRRQGFDDEKGRGNLFFDVARIIEARQPTGFLLENVKNLKSHDGGNTFKVIEETLKDLGYHVKAKVLNSMEYGNIPQNRERIYIVGFKDAEISERFEFPPAAKRTVSVIDILETEVPEKYYYNGKTLFERLKDHVVEEGVVYQWRRQYVRENKSGVCPTLTANMGMGGHNVPIIKDKKGIRKLTPRECFRIQGFPNDYLLPNIADSTLYKQAGNSVSVTVLEAVANQMMQALK
jgi:DNA (cytosine-5)-methyltransferase 1